MSRLPARRQLLAVGLSLALAVPISALVSPAAVASGSGSSNSVMLVRGDHGPRVRLVQRVLDVKPLSGRYTDKTRRSVRHLQNRRGIEVTGVVNARTMNAVRAKWEKIQQYRAHLRNTYRRIMTVARNQKGDPYSYGAAGPSAFDCSGYTMFVYAHAAHMKLEHGAAAQFQRGHRITRKQARPGDLVFMYSGGSIYHASIYAGHGYIWHASTPGTNVRRDPIWTNNVYFARMFDKR
jgi:cell wall-associated NlpC family hydrolase